MDIAIGATNCMPNLGLLDVGLLTFGPIHLTNLHLKIELILLFFVGPKLRQRWQCPPDQRPLLKDWSLRKKWADTRVAIWLTFLSLCCLQVTNTGLYLLKFEDINSRHGVKMLQF